jgi:hypothetical protein
MNDSEAVDFSALLCARAAYGGNGQQTRLRRLIA